MSAGWVATAAVSCAGCRNSDAGQSLVFYQVAASVLAVLLLTGVASEIRELRGREKDGDGAPEPVSKRYVAAVAFVFAFLLLGELLSLIVLVTGDPTSLEQFIVGLALAISVLGVPALVVLAIWEERLRRLRRSLLAVLVLLAVGLASLGVYLAIVSATHSSATGKYHVYGTCASGECGLNERSKPTVDSRPLGQLRDGEEVSVICQTIGTEVPNPQGGSSVVWDRLGTGRYVTDVYVDTPPAGVTIPACPDQASGGKPRG